MKKIRKVENIPENVILVTADVVGLYPNIPHNAGLKALTNMLEAREHKAVSTNDLVKMVRFVLENNYFEFNGDVKKQFSGTAIGTKFAPPYACILMDELETKFLQSQSLQPLVWFRYSDDIFFIWTHGKDKLEKFLDDLNRFDNNIKSTHESSKENVTFLDLIVKLSKGRLTTDLHIKDADQHQYLHFNSSHPDHTKRSIIYSQALRLTKICTFENDFLRHRDEMRLWFQRCGYPEDVINTDMKKVAFTGNFGKSSNKNKGVPFVLTYHPLLKKVNYIIRKYINLLYMNEENKKVFQPGPMVSFRSPRNLSSYLVIAKLYPMERKTGSCKCKGNRCQVCLNVSETETFTSTVTHTLYKINHSFDCNDKCLIYLLTCKTCLE